MASLQSVNYPIELSFDAGVTWKTLVCLTQYNVPTTLSTTETQTFCGIETGVGFQSFKPSGTATCRSFGTLGGTEATYGELLILQNSQTLFLFRVQAPATGSTGRDFYLSGSVYCTDLTLTLNTGAVVEFNWTFSGSGLLDITP